ncbi:MAG: hypothetical protein GWN00_07325, partial [Aliifodinibius sp.]|nr:hypothetical protein [Fodinibius sp.]NIY24626.1 hypothetical protein [Fodinibius sp.]
MAQGTAQKKLCGAFRGSSTYLNIIILESITFGETMRRERVSDDIYVFTSSLYAQVTASAVVQKEGIVVVDTLPYPEETQSMISFLDGLG